MNRVKDTGISIRELTYEKLLPELFLLFFRTKVGRKIIVERLESAIKSYFSPEKGMPISYSDKVKYKLVMSLARQFLRNAQKGYISPQYTRRIMQVFPTLIFSQKRDAIYKEFEGNYGFLPPNFCVISPTQKCNLHCLGCYAASDKHASASLPYEVVERIIREMHDIAGSRFIVISGGEPFLWNDGGRGLLDLAEKFPEVFFHVYTNSMLIGEKEAKRMEKSGNITAAISVEGFEEETDGRRGKGVFRSINAKMQLLKETGVPFGVSVTASRENIRLLLREDFYDTWFEQGATFMWMFHLMPIGRAGQAIASMITPEERRDLLLLVERLIMEKEYFVGDFWNAGAASNGCIAYGRTGGYFYVDWHGNITPCAFIPFYKDNVYQLYQEGKSVLEALRSDFFAKGRAWQAQYGYMKEHPRNFFAPCSIRDHHLHFRNNILCADAKPEDENARICLEDPEYSKALDKFDRKLWELTDPLWEERVKAKYFL